MNSEKVKEIKKALASSFCIDIDYVVNIDGEPTMKRLWIGSVINLINELESENERLKTSEFNSCQELDNAFRQIHSLEDRIAELEKENGELKQHITEVEKGIINIARERNKKEELASKFIDSYNDSLKQFAEKLKEKASRSIMNSDGEIVYIDYDFVITNDIDETLKEFYK